jgi:hypothetical protein
MKIATFWDLIEQSRSAVTKDHAEALVELLASMKVMDVIGFARHLLACQIALDLDHVWLACSLLTGGYDSDDGFQAFRSNLISLGREVFEIALRDPDKLAELLPPDEFPAYENFGYTARHAYERKTGKSFEEDGVEIRPSSARFGVGRLTRPDGAAITHQDAPRRLPKLHQRFREIMGRELAEAKIVFASADPTRRRWSISLFEQFSLHSKEAVDALTVALNDRSKSVRQEAKESLERHRRATERA